MFDIPGRVLYNTTRVIARCTMRLNVNRVLHTPDLRQDFHFEMDLSGLEFGGMCPIVSPVVVDGQVRNIAGMLRLELALDTTLAAVCDRCGEVFDKPFHLDCEYLLATELEDEENDEILLLEDGTVDLGELSREVFILNMPTKLLCREDCRGLCPGCGVNLNYEVCRCKKEVDPRLAKLAQLLEKSENK